MTDWTEASSEVLTIANELIEQYHPLLKEARMGFVFRDEPAKSGNKLVLGKASKISDKFKPYLELDFLIWIAESAFVEMSAEQKKALIDHELCHCSFFDGVARMRHHDIEEFQVIVERWGLWRPDLMTFGAAIEKADINRMNQLAFKIEEGLQKGGVIAVDPAKMDQGEEPTRFFN